MERKQTAFTILGFSIFTSVIYLLSLQRTDIKLNILTTEKLKWKTVAPNFVFILTDDQDSILGSMQAMKNVQKYITEEGITFENSFVASPLCCPSRSSIFSGQYVHNHKAFNNSLSGGCSSKMWQRGPEKKSFVNSLHESGYRTFFAGKYLNQYGRKECGGLSHVPPGWDWWVGLEGNSRYYDYSLSVNGTREQHGRDPAQDYFTNVIRRRALQFLNTTPASPSQPFFMMLSTPSCHAPFDAEPKYSKEFPHAKVPRTPNFNVANDDSKHWLLRLGEQPLSPGIVDELDEIYRKRLRTLLTVDDMVRDVVESLGAKGLLDSTYIIFTSDNGYHLGQFSLPLDKREPYEFDVRVPLYIRGPGISSGVLDYPVTNIDLAPTILDLAGIPIPRHYDGESVKPFLQTTSTYTSVTVLEKANQYMSFSSKKTVYDVDSSPGFRKTLLIEHSGEGYEENNACEHLGPGLYGCNPQFDCKCSDSWNNTYSCLRHIGAKDNFLFCLWKDGVNFEEVYDLENDFYQLNNSIEFVSPNRHRKMLFTLKNMMKCRGPHCRKVSKFVF